VQKYFTGSPGKYRFFEKTLLWLKRPSFWDGEFLISCQSKAFYMIGIAEAVEKAKKL